VTIRFTRRQFLKLALISGAVAGCVQQVSPTPSGVTPAPTAALRFKLENDSIGYQPHPRGCDQTTVRGSVLGIDGAPISGMAIRIWELEPTQATLIHPDEQGFYAADVAAGLTDASYNLQLVDSSGAAASDVIVAAAIRDCRLNYITANFIPAQ